MWKYFYSILTLNFLRRPVGRSPFIGDLEDTVYHKGENSGGSDSLGSQVVIGHKVVGGTVPSENSREKYLNPGKEEQDRGYFYRLLTSHRSGFWRTD